MKHKLKVTIVLLLMFVLSQFIGLYIINTYLGEKTINGETFEINSAKELPYGMAMEIRDKNEPISIYSIILSFVFAFLLIYLLTHLKAKRVMKTWFFIVTTLALGISFTALLPNFLYSSIIGLVLAIPFTYLKIFKGEIISHNFSEILIYPGIAAIFVPIINVLGLIILLVLISIYDMWAVWKSGLMQKMAKYQMKELNIFSGFMVPYVSKKQKEKIRILREKIKSKKITKEEANKKGIKVNIAALGGGDVAFSLISAGVIFKTFGIIPAIATIIGSTLAVSYLLFFGNKNKMYPAMPYITLGIFLVTGISLLLI